MKKFIYILETVLLVLCGAAIICEAFVPQLSFLTPYIKYIYLGTIVLFIALIITIGIDSFGREINLDVKEKPKEGKPQVSKGEFSHELYSDVEKQELGLPVAPRVQVGNVREPVKVVEEEALSTVVKDVVKEEEKVEPVKEEVKPVEAKPEVKKEVKPVEVKPVPTPVKAEPVKVEPSEPVNTEGPQEETTYEIPVILPSGLRRLEPTVLGNFKLFDNFQYKIGKRWAELFKGETDKTYFKDLVKFLEGAYAKNNVYPPKEDLMRCFELCDFDNTRVVIIGKFPFYRKNQADGLAFSTRVGVAPNQTTSIIIKEAISDAKIPVVNSGSLERWARNGVLLLNSIMTAPSDKPASHADCGWVTFTNHVIELLNMDNKPKVFVLWGEYAQGLKPLITNKNHMVLEAPNPSPLSAANGFYGSKPFTKINGFLIKNGYYPIDWKL